MTEGTTKEAELSRDIIEARGGVARATKARSHGRGSDDAVNAAEDRLTKAHDRLKAHHRGIIETGRDR
jgi:hypothetical protein